MIPKHFCQTCVHWDAHTRACHRYPPGPMGWSLTDPLGWCGEHAARLEDVPQERQREQQWHGKSKRR